MNITVELLTCIVLCTHTTQSCDEEYLAITGKQYRQECLEQQIDSALTGYTWELSRDGSQFQQVTQTTAFTDTQVKVLEPVYLAPGLFVLCSTQAVDTYGTKGYSRTSLPSNLSQLVGECKERSWEATMFSYPGFSGAAEVRTLHASEPGVC